MTARCTGRCKIAFSVTFLLLVVTITTMKWNPRKRADNAVETPPERKTRRNLFIDITTTEYKLGNKYFQSEAPSISHNVVTKSKRPRHLTTFHFQKKNQKYTCVPFKLPNGLRTPFCIFDPTKDRMISSYIKDFGTWEPDLLSIAAEIASKYPNIVFLDLGCNLGTFTVTMASLGVKVIAVDALSDALVLLQETLQRGDNFTGNVTIFNYAISDGIAPVVLKMVNDNPGGSYLHDSGDTTDTRVIPSLQLDDLTPFVTGSDVFIKIDIEGSEWKALQGAVEFFNQNNVRFVLLEWMLHKGGESGRHIVNFLLSRGFLPYLNYTTSETLSIDAQGWWQDNVFWAKR